jgi:hypothetical protein
MPVPEYLAGGVPDPRRLVARFEWLDATVPERARPREDLEAAAWIPPGIWDRFVDQGVIKEAAPGLFYLARRPRRGALDSAF